MKVKINGNLKEVSSSNLLEILKELGFDHQRYVVVLNENIVPKSQVAETLVNEGDDIEILTIMGGG